MKSLILPVGEDYTLGPGDEVIIYMIGLPPDSKLPPVIKTVIDREGKIYIPNLGVFYLWGITIGEAQKILSQSLGTQIKITVGKLRTFPVYVSGEVNKPGAIVVTGVNTVIDALALAGGVKKTGSLRNIIITRRTSNGLKKIPIDLYKVLINGEPVDIRVKEGDVILVPPIGKTAAIAGDVKRPAIYELKEEKTVNDLIKLAGGLLPSAYKYKITIERYDENRNLKIIEGNLEDKKFLQTTIKDGDLIILKKIIDLAKNVYYLEGYVAYPGSYEYKSGLTLKDVITKDILLPDTNLDYAEIERYNLKTLQKEIVIKFSPKKVLEGIENLKLRPYDRIVLYPKYLYKPIKISGDVEHPLWIHYKPNLTLAEALANVKFTKPVEYLKAIVLRREKKNLKQEVFTVYLFKLLKEGNQNLNITLQPGDEILVKTVSKDEITLKVIVKGFVKKPGVYKISEGTTLYDILKRAGGFRPEAYPEGIVILRKSIAKMQQERLNQAITLMQQTLEKEEAGIMQADLTPQQVESYKYAFEAKRRLLKQMEKTQITGRIVGLKIPKNIDALRHSPYNIKLEDGDQIFVPQKPSTVLVFGEVFNPSAIVYRKGLRVKDYIQLAGGFTKYADIENIFVIKANGVAISSQTDSSLIRWDGERKRFIWGGSYNEILDYKLQPGDAIIVPTKVKVPTFWRPLIKDVIQIIYQSALTVYTISKL